jgi:AhpD family alkylhydroperoxidase
MYTMTKMFMACVIVAMMAVPAYADDPPQFMQDTYPKQALQAAWEEYQVVYGPDGAIPPKLKQLIGIAVAAQIPCDYCVSAHTRKAKQAGATDAEIKEALAVAALTRKWSTVLNGSAYDMEKFKAALGGRTQASSGRSPAGQ